MKPAPFEYHRPSTAAEVDNLLADLGGQAKILSGGQSLVPLLNMRLVSPEHVVDISGLTAETTDPQDTGGTVRIGAMVRHSAVAQSSVVADRVPLLAATMELVAHPAIRNRGTLVGAIAHADPASEVPAAAVLLRARMLARSARGERSIPASEFFTGPLESALAEDEWLHAVDFPNQVGNGAVEEFARRQGDYALCGVLALARPRGSQAAVGMSYFGVGDAPEVFELTGDLTSSESLAEAIAALVATQLDPHDDIHATAAYRSHLARALGARVASQALKSHQGDGA